MLLSSHDLPRSFLVPSSFFPRSSSESLTSAAAPSPVEGPLRFASDPVYYKLHGRSWKLDDDDSHRLRLQASG
jgi:hypothetical protein